MKETALQESGRGCPDLRPPKAVAAVALSVLCLIATYTQTRDIAVNVDDVVHTQLPATNTNRKRTANTTLHFIPWGKKDDHPGRVTSDILKLRVPAFSKDYKNPCWRDYRLDRVRCLPYFFIAGMPKSGTTDLWYSLGKHPQVRILQGKEPHWWTRGQYSRKGTVERYVKYFDKSATAISEKCVKRKGRKYHPLITGDASASTLWDNYNWKLIPENHKATKEPRILHAHLIRHLMPNAKFIVILRNPIDRVYSGYLYFTRSENKSQGAFHNACVKAISAMTACTKSHTMRYCVYNKLPNISTQTSVRLIVGLYAFYIKDWFNVYPSEQMHFIRMENYSRDRAKILKDVFDFLELDPLQNMTAINNMPVENRRLPKFRHIGKMLNKTRSLLADFYRPYGQDLRWLLKDRKFDFSNFDN